MILICGASGLVGKEMCSFLDDNNINYIGTYNKNIINKENMYKINFSNQNIIEEFLLFHKIKTCIFCIVERLTDVCEHKWDEIKKTNIDLVNITSYICNKLNIKFIHLSTDYVFDGSIQPNYPNSLKNPLQNYGISKLVSEYKVITNCKKFCIIRTPVLYSSLSKIHDNAVCLIGKNVMDLRNKLTNEDNYSIRRPLYIKDLCIFIYDCINENFNGIYHFYNPYNKFTKYNICQKISNYLKIPINNIIPHNIKNEGIASRPYDTQLLDDNFNILNYNFHDFDETIKECFQKFNHTHIKVENKQDIFICMDLDGTIIESNIAHYNAYKKVFLMRNCEFLSIDEWNYIIMYNNIDNYLKKIFGNEIDHIKEEKLNYLKHETISFTKNNDLFLKFLIENNFNFCIVSNANKNTVNIFKKKLPLLNKVKQWILRDDYENPKPNGECYLLAKNKYYKQEKYIIGIEDSMVGYNSLKCLTNVIYIYDNDSIFKNNDCFLFNDYLHIM